MSAEAIKALQKAQEALTAAATALVKEREAASIEAPEGWASQAEIIDDHIDDLDAVMEGVGDLLDELGARP